MLKVIPLRFERKTHALEGQQGKNGYTPYYQIFIFLFAENSKHNLLYICHFVSGIEMLIVSLLLRLYYLRQLHQTHILFSFLL